MEPDKAVFSKKVTVNNGFYAGLTGRLVAERIVRRSGFGEFGESVYHVAEYLVRFDNEIAPETWADLKDLKEAD